MEINYIYTKLNCKNALGNELSGILQGREKMWCKWNMSKKIRKEYGITWWENEKWKYAVIPRMQLWTKPKWQKVKAGKNGK